MHDSEQVHGTQKQQTWAENASSSRKRQKQGEEHLAETEHVTKCGHKISIWKDTFDPLDQIN